MAKVSTIFPSLCKNRGLQNKTDILCKAPQADALSVCLFAQDMLCQPVASSCQHLHTNVTKVISLGPLDFLASNSLVHHIKH